MSQLAPGRVGDMQRLIDRRNSLPKHSAAWNGVCLKIEDLIEEGKDRTIHGLRERLIGAHRVNDINEIEKISMQIDKHVKQTNPLRWKRAWLKEG